MTHNNVPILAVSSETVEQFQKLQLDFSVSVKKEHKSKRVARLLNRGSVKISNLTTEP